MAAPFLMILETMPAARLLSSAEKRQLAEELWTSADSEEGETSVDAAILRLLDQRLTDHETQPQATSTWDEVKRRIFDGHAA